jgi:hypothetical protein
MTWIIVYLGVVSVIICAIICDTVKSVKNRR